MALGACANSIDRTQVSSIDDYRTNHPMVVADKEHVIDLPVPPDHYGMSIDQRHTLAGFLSRYDAAKAPVLAITIPSGGQNDAAALRTAADFRQYAHSRGIRQDRIIQQTYQAGPDEVAPPVRLSYMAVRAQVAPCGNWPENLMDNEKNRHYRNFGCSYQNNIAAQLANPNDLLGPRELGEIDQTKRGGVLSTYRGQSGAWSPALSY
ncbi:pilus biogenesis lipoprotein CpaD [Limoniibacter endophyticus]|uniref:Pilus biogenesis lipoprotein CpaD n=2 Tax=Limoniibacter endophyticus TaxID=1565040 RepID=A0A8J3DN98_9HYPH|nr:pilus biogenesis lipoprotein CpaD [Limoniibacter endophyticus]